MSNAAIHINPATGDSTHVLVTLLQLGRRARTARTLAELGFVMVNETLQLLRYRQAGLWLNTGLGLSPEAGRIVAVSGIPDPEANAPYTQWLARLARHLSKAEAAEPRPLTSADLPGLLAADWSQWLPEQALWLPLADVAGKCGGGLLLAREEPWTPPERALAKELGEIYQHAAQALSPRRHWAVDLRRLWQPRRNQILALAGVIAIACFPVRLSVLAPAEVVPRDPFLVRAPLDGVVEHFFVRPNQTVTAQTPLFGLDTTVLQSQHALAQQAYDTAQEEYRQAAQMAVTDDKSKLEMALRRGAMAEKSVELEYSAEQLGRVQVKAERAGVAVFSDINDWQGKAVVVGEKILLLADPDKVELNIDLPASDNIGIEPGADVKLYPSASPVSSYNATVATVAYRAEPTPGGVLAYRIKAEFPANQPPPRLGMMGTAKISGRYVPLCYYMLRKPLAATRQRLGW
jgi:hypothetical protein